MAPKIGRLEGKHGVARTVGLYEAVAREGAHHVPDGLDGGVIDATRPRARQKGGPVPLELSVGILLRENLTDTVGVFGGETGKGNRGLRMIEE